MPMQLILSFSFRQLNYNTLVFVCNVRCQRLTDHLRRRYGYNTTMSTAFTFTSSILQNGVYMLVCFPVFFVLALVVHKKTGAVSKAGRVMLVSSLPGVLFAVACVGMWLAAFVIAYGQVQSGTFDYAAFYSANVMLYEIPSTLALISTLLLPAVGLISIVCGALLFSKKKCTVCAVLSIVLGVSYLVFFGLMLLVLAAWGGLLE